MARTPTRTVRPTALLAALLACAGCGTPGASAGPPEIRATSAAVRPDAGALTPTELRYVRQTAMTIYRRRPIERTAFLPGGEGWRLCVRSRGTDGRLDHTLLTLQRRIADDFISQAADDVQIERGRAGTAICRNPANTWIALR